MKRPRYSAWHYRLKTSVVIDGERVWASARAKTSMYDVTSAELEAFRKEYAVAVELDLIPVDEMDVA